MSFETLSMLNKFGGLNHSHIICLATVVVVEVEEVVRI